jgi:hypothetical protein
MTTKGLYFDGTKKQYASFKGLPDSGPDHTLEFWLRAPAWSEASENQQPIIEFGGNYLSFGVFLEVQQGVVSLNFWEQYADKQTL